MRSRQKMNRDMQTWDKARLIQTTLTEKGFETCITGGAVRDLYLNRESSDIDLSTEAKSEQVMALFERTKPTGIDFGTVLVIVEGEGFEVTTFRGSTITDDLSCRDFTINAMALSQELKLIDPFNGKQDLLNRRIQTVRATEETLLDDPIRMIRSLRFAVQFGFQETDELLICIDRHCHLIHHVSVERLEGEFKKISQVPWTLNKSRHCIDHPALRSFDKLFSHVLVRTGIRKIGFPAKEMDPILWWLLAVYQDDAPESIRAHLKSYRLSNRIVKTVTATCQMTDIYRAKRTWSEVELYEAGEAVIRYACMLLRYLISDSPELEQQMAEYRALPVKHRNELAVSGRELMHHLPELPKKTYTFWINELINQVLNGQIENEEASLITYLKERIKS